MTTDTAAAFTAKKATLHAAVAASAGVFALRKRTISNLFRYTPRERASSGIDLAGFNRIIGLDPESTTLDVEGLTTYQDVVTFTLAHGLLPLISPELKHITVGGATVGIGIESSCFRHGFVHDGLVEAEVLLPDGRIVLCRADNEYADLFHALPNSYGTLGYALRLRIDLEPVSPYVKLRHVRFHDLDALQSAIATIVDSRSFEGEPVEFVDGTVFTADEGYLSLGSWATRLPDGVVASDYTGMSVYYRSIQKRQTDYLTVRDYLWRWDADWFWCSRAFGAQNPRIRRLWPKRWLRSDVYWRLIKLENRYHVAARLDARKGLPPRERVVQDVEIPLARTAAFLRWFLREVPIEPVWLCPIRLRDEGATAQLAAADPGGAPWPLYPLRPGQTYVNVGFWSTVPITGSAQDGDANRSIEHAVAAHDGHKSLYSDAYYGEDEFWDLYGGTAYRAAKDRYDPRSRLLDLYAKAVKRR